MKIEINTDSTALKLDEIRNKFKGYSTEDLAEFITISNLYTAMARNIMAESMNGSQVGTLLNETLKKMVAQVIHNMLFNKSEENTEINKIFEDIMKGPLL